MMADSVLPSPSGAASAKWLVVAAADGSARSRSSSVAAAAE